MKLQCWFYMTIKLNSVFKNKNCDLIFKVFQTKLSRHFLDFGQRTSTKVRVFILVCAVWISCQVLTKYHKDLSKDARYCKLFARNLCYLDHLKITRFLKSSSQSTLRIEKKRRFPQVGLKMKHVDDYMKFKTKWLIGI